MKKEHASKGPARARWLALGLACVCLSVYSLRQPILRRIAANLVRADQAPVAADILVIGGDGASRAASVWLAEHPAAKLLLAAKPPPRVVQVGATVSEAERRVALAKSAGIPEDRIEILMGTNIRHIRPVTLMGQWLNKNPERRIHVLCDQFQSRGLRRAAESSLHSATASRITLGTLVDQRFSVDDWWRTRLGIRAVFDAYLGLTRSVLGLRSPEPPDYLTPDQYEQAFLDSLQLGQ